MIFKNIVWCVCKKKQYARNIYEYIEGVFYIYLKNSLMHLIFMIMNITFKNTKYDIKKYNERTSYNMIRVVCVFYFTKRYYEIQ